MWRPERTPVGVDLFHPRYPAPGTSPGAEAIRIRGLSAGAAGAWWAVSALAAVLVAAGVYQAWKLYDIQRRVERISDQQRLAAAQLSEQGLGLVPGVQKEQVSPSDWKDLVDDTELRNRALNRLSAGANVEAVRAVRAAAPDGGQVLSVKRSPGGRIEVLGRVAAPADADRWARNLAKTLGLPEVRLSAVEVRKDGVAVALSFDEKGGGR